MTFCFLLIFLYIIVYLHLQVIEASLVLVQTLARHGDRTPSHTYPTDPYIQQWEDKGMEQMTQLGVEQHLELGRYLRKRYAEFLPLQFHKDEVYVRSTSTERTLLSAQSCMSTLYPPIEEDKSSQIIGHQLVPVHSIFKPYDQLLKMSSPCPKYKKLLKQMHQSPPFVEREKDNAEFVRYVSTYSGKKNLTLLKAIDVCDNIVVLDLQKLAPPEWVNSSITKRCHDLHDFKHTYRFSTPQLSRLKGGPLVRQMISDMKAVMKPSSSPRRRKLISYFAHDSTLAAFMSHLRVHNSLKPPLASCVMVELHRKQQSTNKQAFFVRMFFRNDTRVEPHPLQIRGYPTADIDFEDIVKLFLDDIPLDIMEECESENGISFKRFWEPRGWSQVLLLVFLIMGSFALLKKFSKLF